MFLKCAKGYYDTFAIAGTGYGKSLVFALLAVAVALVESKGTVMVICPLKALQIDQVHYLHWIMSNPNSLTW
jgi:superfamily II DNA helicase RecQ